MITVNEIDKKLLIRKIASKFVNRMYILKYFLFCEIELEGV